MLPSCPVRSHSLLADKHSRLAVGHEHTGPLPRLHDLDQPYTFNIKLYNRPYQFQLYDTASPTNYTLLKPAVLVMCYNIADPKSLHNVSTNWRCLVETHYNYDEMLPVILLGLQRDVRSREDYQGHVRRLATYPTPDEREDSDDALLNGRNFVYPQEGLRLAQEMRCDRYCECSALTGELCREVIEDISRTAAKTTTAKGAKSEGPPCSIM